MELSGHQSFCYAADLVVPGFVPPLIGTITFMKLSGALLFRATIVDVSCLLSTMGLADLMMSSYDALPLTSPLNSNRCEIGSYIVFKGVPFPTS